MDYDTADVLSGRGFKNAECFEDIFSCTGMKKAFVRQGGEKIRMEEKKIIEFRNIVKNFDGQIVLKGVNLDIYEKEFVTLLGPSGCGKTTLLRILGGFLDADEGSVIFDGEEISI